MMPELKPRTRRYLVKAVDPENPRFVLVSDLLGLSPPLRLSAEEAGWFDQLDGARDVAAIAGSGGSAGAAERLAKLVWRLDESFFLDGPRFRRIVDSPLRPPRCLGCYESTPDALRRQLAGYFTNPRGPGLPQAVTFSGRPESNRLRGALIPHIDYPRGGVSYAWGFKEVVENTDASLFVIIGTSHYSQHRFTLTRKNFQTPLGITPTNQDYINRLVNHYGNGLFDDEWLAHLPEHSIELEVVFLQYLYERKWPISIVPLVVGSFGDCIMARSRPTARPEIVRMIEALRLAEAETPEPICYIISGDLAHIGPKFDDPIPLTAARLEYSRKQDLAILRQAEAARPATYYQTVADDGDARNVCGLSPTFTFLEAARPTRGKLMHYDQYVDPDARESVSFASVGFYDDTVTR